MADNTNNRFTPEIICTSEHTFNIPIYQRLFEWEKDNIEQLLNDMLFEYNRNSTNPSPYYIGMLTLYENDLVDGQQRFTVLSIIASVFKNLYEPWANMKGKLHLKARFDDERYLSSLFDEKEITDYTNKKMHNGKETVIDWVNKNLNASNKKEFAKYVYEKCTFFMATLPQNYKPSDLNKYFEAMNSTGRNLESHEIIKVEKYLKSIKDNQPFYNQIWNLVADMDKLLIRYKTEGRQKESEDELRQRYKELFLNFDSYIEKKSFIYKNNIELLNDFHEDEEQDSDFQTISELEADGHNPDVRRQDKYFGDGYHSALNFPEFLLQILFISLNEETRNKVNVNEFFDVHALQKIFKEYTNDWNGDNWKKFGEDLLRYRILYDYFVLRVPNSEFNPYDLEFSEPEKEKETDSNMIKQLQSVLYVDSSSKTYYRWIVPFLEFINKNHNASATQIFKELQRIDNTIKEHSEDILNNPKDISFGGRYTVYFLRRLDFYLWLDNHKLSSQKIDPVINNYKFKRSYNSQEHLHPQNDENREGYEPWGDYKHKFGNLFLISSSFNSTQSDDTINTKFGRILDQISSNSIESIKLYKILEFCKEEEKTGSVAELAKCWTIKKMEEHQKKMLQRLHDSYKE
ncbi:MAG: DUF262 domain-containing protein [Treponema sp.]|nr:DUF262 domain-containing protein [Treponema sp.]